ncbi:cytochrome C oxidase subunit IV family protein [Denitromonas ohlonensis]|uniref:Cytochrome C oxidase subunit IV family protein n=2 Tax=Denitromonas TaxID=139331 RepID=A0A557SDH7_9RHOO|nr:cytochrome C oxidase subunit IV family protein [Denitromonas ohlonensis]TVO63504.1 hypothetical protein FHP90_13560 [Denitromonas ohlonensis]TVO75381.1 hypothetical protein FHP89_13595 [Denitromonas ohlonensis]TVT70620.1 MAG: hypothetical protein FHP92_18015 [Denitromonas halophila]
MTEARETGFLRQGTNIAWLLLVGSTLFGWWLGHVVHSADEYVRIATAGVLVTAFVKTWIVGFQFMELRHAPWWLRHAFHAWVLVMCVVLLILCV